MHFDPAPTPLPRGPSAPRATTAVWLALVCCAAGACQDDVLARAQCAADPECPAGSLCLSGSCQQLCGRDSDCLRSGEGCRDGLCSTVCPEDDPGCLVPYAGDSATPGMTPPLGAPPVGDAPEAPHGAPVPETGAGEPPVDDPDDGDPTEPAAAEPEPTTCTPAADGCTAGADEEESQWCGNCGRQSRSRSCGDDCRWGEWRPWEACAGEAIVHTISGRGYWFCPNPTEAWEAHTVCWSAGLRVVRIDDHDENVWVRGTASSAGLGSLWLGASDAGVEGAWRWGHPTVPFDQQDLWSGGPAGTGTGVFTAWAGGEPNDAGGAAFNACGQWAVGEDYALMLPGGEWNDACSSTRLPFVCEPR